jgi:hypothetical protein
MTVELSLVDRLIWDKESCLTLGKNISNSNEDIIVFIYGWKNHHKYYGGNKFHGTNILSIRANQEKQITSIHKNL